MGDVEIIKKCKCVTQIIARFLVQEFFDIVKALGKLCEIGLGPQIQNYVHILMLPFNLA